MSHKISRKTLQQHLEDALWREALARLAIDALIELTDDPTPERRVEADNAEFAYRMARRLHTRPTMLTLEKIVPVCCGTLDGDGL